MEEFIQVATTVASRGGADAIARVLVERRLAGCVQIIGPIRSVYRWSGNVEQADEWLCLVKTGCDQYAAVEAAIRELHSYECPEIFATPIVAGSAAYLAWLGEQL